MALKRTMRLSLIALSVMAPVLSCWQPAFAKTITLWCGNERFGYDTKFTVDFANKTVRWGNGKPFPVQLNAYRISWQWKTTMPWHGGTDVTINWYRIDRVKGTYSHGFRSWVEYNGKERSGTEQSGTLPALNCVKGNKPPAPTTKF